MEEPKSPSSCRSPSDDLYYVRNEVELCIQYYMNLERTAKYLEKNHKISKTQTHIVWEILREENPEFFKNFDLRCQMLHQMRMFNYLLTKEAVQMFETGLLDICDTSASVRTLLRQKHPERVHLLETLASKRKLSSESSAMPYANGISVAQSQNPYDQQEQVLRSASFAMPNPNGSSASQWQMPNEQLNQQHLYASSLPMQYANGPSVTQLPIPDDQPNQHLSNLPFPYENSPSVMQMHSPYDQQDQHPYSSTSLPLPTANGPSMTQLPIPNSQQDPCPASNSLGAPNFAPVETDDWLLLHTVSAFPDLPKLDLGDDIGLNGPSFLDVADTLMHFDEQEKQQQYQPHWQQQQNVQVVEGINGLENGDIIDEYLCDNFDITFVDQQQAGGVEQGQTHHPESEALNNHDSAQLVTQPQQDVPVVTLQRGDGSNDDELCNNIEQKQKQTKRMCTSFDQQQTRRVKRQCPESEGLTNPNTGNGTSSKDLQRQGP